MGGITDLLNTAGTGILENAAAGIGGSLGSQLSYGLGELTGYNDKLKKDQIEQQKALTNIQYAANYNLMKASYEQQYDMWNKTNFEAQIAHLKNAGLNPALMYAKGGAGGTTGGGGASVGGSNASDVASMRRSNTEQQMAGMAMMKLQSEIKVNESIANMNNAQVPKLGAETQTLNATRDALVSEINSKIDNLKADTSLKGEQSNLIKLQEDTAKIANEFNAENNAILLQNNMQLLRKLSAEANVSEATQNSLIELARKNVELATSQMLLNNSTIKLQDMDRKLISAKIGEIMNSIVISKGQLKLNQATFEQAMEIEKMRLSSGAILNQLRGVATSIRNALTNSFDYSW